MTSTPRRPGFRLPWAGEADKTDAPAADEPRDVASTAAEPVSDTPAADPVSAEPSSVVAASAPPPSAPAAKTPVERPDVPAHETVASPAAEPFLQHLVDAMRRVAEEARDTNLAELRSMVEKRVEQASERGSERAEDLRRRSELDIKGIGDWERTELDRVRGEAEAKVEARRKQLEQQMQDHQEATERDVASVRRRLADHERELAAFFAQLTEIREPSAFVAAAKRMPGPPSLELNTPADAASGAASVDAESLTSRLSMLGIEAGESAPAASADGSASAPTESPTADPTLAERLAQLDAQRQTAPTERATPPAPPAADGAGEVSTAIVVKGLGSFGAITSFKQSLEKIEGIHSVTLSLGPTGEFVYRASHDAGFDIEGVIGKLEGGSAELERQADGTLGVTVNRSR
jgi:hypothetical protein